MIKLYRIIDASSGYQNYLKIVGAYHHKSYESIGLRKYVLKYSTELSYESVSTLVKDKDGSSLLSDQRIQQIVVETGEDISLLQKQEIAKCKKRKPIGIDYTFDLYDPNITEIEIYEDAIGVRGQKKVRDNSLKTNREWHYTDVVLLEQADGTFKHIVPGLGLEMSAVFEMELKKAYGLKRKSLPIVCFSDGATAIRDRMKEVLGKKVKIILDWYHLNKKIWGFMSMIAVNKEEKKEKSNLILHHLWKGDLEKALTILSQVDSKNEDKQKDLINYLRKRESQIINYEKRKELGKTIGSGRVEKACDVIIGMRQKGNAKSWSPKGSRALALVKMQLENTKMQ